MAKKSPPLITRPMRALIRNPAVHMITVTFAYSGVVGDDGMTRLDYVVTAFDRSSAELGRLVVNKQTFRLTHALDGEILWAGFLRRGEVANGMADTTEYVRNELKPLP